MCLCLFTDSLDFQPNRKIIVNEHIALTVRLYTTLHKSNGLPPLSGSISLLLSVVRVIGDLCL